MKQITMHLDENYLRPIVRSAMFYGLAILIDSGADFPVWVADEESLIVAGGKSLNTKGCFHGFGGVAEGNMYRLTVNLGTDENNSIIFNDMPLIACKTENKPNFQLILPATAFANMMYQIDNINHRFNLDIADNQTVINLKYKLAEDGPEIYSTE